MCGWTNHRGNQEARRRLTAAERARYLAAYRTGGLTQERFAAEHRLKLATLCNWIYRPTRDRREQTGGSAHLQIIGARPAGTRNALTVRWPHGVELELAADLDDPGLLRLVRELLVPCLR